MINFIKIKIYLWSILDLKNYYLFLKIKLLKLTQQVFLLKFNPMVIRMQQLILTDFYLLGEISNKIFNNFNLFINIYIIICII